jgi:hypothetical protein
MKVVLDMLKTQQNRSEVALLFLATLNRGSRVRSTPARRTRAAAAAAAAARIWLKQRSTA